MIIGLDRAQKIIQTYCQKKDIAFVFGNGINRYENPDGSTVSWYDLLLRVWDTISTRTLSDIADGITFTEFYNIMELEANSSKMVRDKATEIIKTLSPTPYEIALKSRLIEIDCPVLTTNFDANIEKGLGRYRLHSLKGFSDYYPWEVYYSNRQIADPLEGFAVWHINGMQDYPRSIRLSFSEYINLTARARAFIHSNYTDDNFYRKNVDYWGGHNTWLHLIFNCNLCIIGLALDEQETFLRWLLLERVKYFRKFPDRKKKGWYVCTADDLKNRGKQMFLEYLGFEIVCLDDFDSIYRGILNIYG